MAVAGFGCVTHVTVSPVTARHSPLTQTAHSATKGTMNNGNRELTINDLGIVSGGSVHAQGDLKGALAKLEKEIKSRGKILVK
jgi:hypothetical protein